jgi:hypothetical protein
MVRFISLLFVTIFLVTASFVFKRRNQMPTSIQDLITRFETETGETIVIFRSNNGGEFMSKDLIQWLTKRGIIHQTSTPKTPEQNGVAERYNRTILESMKRMLHSSTLPINLLAEASAAAVYLLNRVTCKAVPSMTPYQAWYGKKPNVSHLHVFGCDALHTSQRMSAQSWIEKESNLNSLDTPKRKRRSVFGILHLEKLKSPEM